MKFIDKVGLEIEGGWDGTPGESPFEFPLKRELSVPDMGEKIHVGEAATPDPLEPEEVPSWLAKHWPHQSDQRCGMHVHVSVRDPSYYAELATLGAYEFILAELERWGKREELTQNHLFWHRMGLRGDSNLNRFCRRVFDPTSQMKVKNKNGHDERRAILNYCWDMHKTLECRVFPMFAEGPEVAARGAMAFVKACEDILHLRAAKFGESLDMRVTPMRRKVPSFAGWDDDDAPPRAGARPRALNAAVLAEELRQLRRR